MHSSALYNVVTLRRRKPNDWYVVQLTFRGLSNGEGASMPAAFTGYMMAKFGPAAGKLGSIGRGNQAPASNLTDDEFEQSLNSHLLGMSGFIAFSPLLSSPPASAGGQPFGVQNARLVGEETWNQQSTYKIEGMRMGWPVILWIEKSTGLIVRTVLQQGAGPSQHPVFEAIYTNSLNARFSAADFVYQIPSLESQRAGAELTPQQMGFGDVADLRGLMTNPANSASTPATPPAAPAAPQIPAVAEQQVLSAGQMAGIILIEGDEGTATGFMTKIRGVDFVVTNQHVLGENKKLTLKNLHGEVLPVLAIFGAVGSDIAILKISKGEGDLKLADDVLKSMKIGDKVVVVGNRQGGGVATQISGQVLGVGPTRIEVNANFEPGNSGSPIFSQASSEVVGVATYAETRRVAVEDSSGSDSDRQSAVTPSRVEKRWFGYRIDGITKWEGIDLARWHAQSERIGQFRDMSDALRAIIRLKFSEAAKNARLASVIADFQAHTAQRGNNRLAVGDDVKAFFYSIRSLAESGIRDFETGDYYDYYRTCLYWEESVPMQVEYRKAIVDVLKKYEANSTAYVSRMRNGE
ncbi:MAG: trypsin-like peptidase domain-containing protein [Verrucomicrobia bacterium]|nr:trypsin-like peptidase domain-containing protein [Verrucomicrobiota bacterium]